MKKLSLLTLAVSSLMLFSFFLQDKGIKKINDHLWEVSSKAKFADADKQSLQAVVKKEYGIKDFKTAQSLEFKNASKAKKVKVWVLVNNTIGPAWVSTKVAVGDVTKKVNEIPASATEMMAILGNY